MATGVPLGHSDSALEPEAGVPMAYVVEGPFLTWKPRGVTPALLACPPTPGSHTPSDCVHVLRVASVSMATPA